MVCYQITLFVTKEQENAIIGLFATRNWPYKKKDYDSQLQLYFSPHSQSQGTPENVSQKQCAELDHFDVKPEISVATVYAGPNSSSMLAKNYEPCVNSGSDWDTERTAYSKRLLQAAKINQPNHTAQSEISSSIDDETNSSTNTFPSLITESDEKIYPNMEVNKTLDEPELRTNFSSDNNLEAIEDEDHSKLKTLRIFETSSNLENITNAERSCSSEESDLNKHIKSETETAHQNFPEACDNADSKKLKGMESNINLEDKKRKQVKQPANRSEAQTSAYIYCSGCEHSFRHQKRYEDHLKYDRCSHVCEFCGKIFLFRKSYDFKRHMNYHKKQKDHKCHICGKLFIEKPKMLQHVKLHSCPNPVICEVCGLGFSTTKAVNMHKYHMHNNNREQELCPKCPKTFKSKAGLFYHIRTTHSKVCIETCDICNKTFNDKILLKAHMITHVESFDHKCDVCNAAFKRVSGLYQHKRRHKKAFSHFCKFCQKGFYDGRAAQEHENLHTGAKPHVCSVCGYSCAVRSNLTKHVKLVHKNVTS